MDWKELGASVAKLGLPLLGAALPIPGGAALGAALAGTIGASSAKPEDILATLSANAQAVAAARSFELTHQETILKLTMDAEVAGLQTVNTTMVAETKADHWPTYTWRPFLGFVFGIMTLGCYFALPLLHVAVPAVPETVWGAYLAILGVSAYYRGRMQADPHVPSDNRG